MSASASKSSKLTINSDVHHLRRGESQSEALDHTHNYVEDLQGGRSVGQVDDGKTGCADCESLEEAIDHPDVQRDGRDESVAQVETARLR
jgi:hypothetical protein